MFQLECSSGTVIGRDGICYSYDSEGRPRIPVQIYGDLSEKWTEIELLVDTGADVTLLHSDVASRVGLDINRYDRQGLLGGIGEYKIPIYYKKGILIRISNFPAIPLTIGFSAYLRRDLRLLGRETILSLFGFAFDSKKIGIFDKTNKESE